MSRSPSTRAFGSNSMTPAIAHMARSSPPDRKLVAAEGDDPGAGIESQRFQLAIRRGGHVHSRGLPAGIVVRQEQGHDPQRQLSPGTADEHRSGTTLPEAGRDPPHRGSRFPFMQREVEVGGGKALQEKT